MSFKKIVACTVVVSAGLASGCASIVSGGPRTVTISSSPSGVPFVIKNRAGTEVASGTTPSTQALPAKAGFFKGETYAVTYKPQWASEQTRTLNSNLNGWYWGNIIFGGLLGLLIVDPATGAMWSARGRAGSRSSCRSGSSHQLSLCGTHRSRALPGFCFSGWLLPSALPTMRPFALTLGVV
ncbi:MAG: hypothetical protein K0S16_740, partial [Moraxellaceae bacterium]|nr:hypothetical protein [Moraxellaceae bacterium]